MGWYDLLKVKKDSETSPLMRRRFLLEITARFYIFAITIPDPMNQLRLLILEEESAITDALHEFLSREGIFSYKATGSKSALSVIEKNSVDIVIVDMFDHGFNRFKFIHKLKSDHPEIDILAIDRIGSIRKPEDISDIGLFDYFSKPFYWKELERSIRRTVAYYSLQNYKDRIEANFGRTLEILHQKGGPVFSGVSSSLKQVTDLMMHAAGSGDTSVLVTGESGTGKEMVARGIHLLSHNDISGFIAVNCASVPASRFETEFFGEELRADGKMTGWFEVANGGTLYLKGIDDLSYEMQAKLLGVLDHRNIFLVGSHREVKLDQRLIASLNMDPKTAITEKRLRFDLLNRINAFHIHIPPLRERSEDIPELLDFFMARFAQKLKKPVKQIDHRALSRLVTYCFPGNVRELKNMVERAVILATNHSLRLEHFYLPDSPGEDCMEKSENVSGFNLEQVERSTIKKALQAANHNKVKAAKLLNISRQSLDRKISKLKISL
jgi:DNA-binding NtrC family response regulator